MKESEEQKLYDFGTDPMEVHTHYANRSDKNYFTHLIRKPNNAQWIVWGHEIFEERHYFTDEEIIEENKKRDEDDQMDKGWFEHSFSSFTASHRLYCEIAISITEHLVDDEGDFIDEKTFPATPELLDRPIGVDKVIEAIGRFYCHVDGNSDGLEADEIRVLQMVGRKNDDYFDEDNGIFVSHILRKPMDESRRKFLNEATRICIVPEKINTQRISYDFRIAQDIYDEMLVKIEGATANSKNFEESNRSEFLGAISPIIKFWIMQEYFGERLLIFS